MAKLSDLGFLKGIIVETIVSTYNEDKTPNAAPMGVLIRDEQHLTIDLFNSTLTCRNIAQNMCAVLNLTSNIEVFYKTTFKEANPDGKLPADWFEKSQVINAPKIRLADATIDIAIDKFLPVDEQKTKAVFNVKLIEAKEKYPQVHSRAMSQTLEAIIHATRVKALSNDPKQRKKVNHLLEMIDDCDKVVNRVAPNSPYSLVMADLIKRIDLWRRQK
ncbi:MAG TPA: DUF447 domain-containing protein [Candidatus Acidoferrum sp.]|nr:DUF447 domain-containing protein [Candidatus Acidoferrum sp.]